MNKIILEVIALVICLENVALCDQSYNRNLLDEKTSNKTIIFDQEGRPEAFVLKRSKRDRLYWGPEFFWARESSQIRGIHIRDKAMYYGLRAGYDFLRPNSLYAGVDFLYAFGRLHIKAYKGKIDFFKDHTRGVVSNGELRLGYNFRGEKPFYFTPYAGIGGYHLRPTRSIHYVQNWLYLAAGMRAEHEVNSTFNIGLNLKGMKALYLEQRVKKHHKYAASYHKSSNALGYEISVPLTIRMGYERNWDLRAEPYYLKLNSHTDTNVIGGLLSFSVRY